MSNTVILQLLHFVLDTSEIKVNHTSENLLMHVKMVIDKFDLEPNVNDVLINYDSTQPQDNFAVDENDDVVYLRTVNYYSDDVQASQMSQSQSQYDMSQTQMTTSQMSESYMSQSQSDLIIFNIFNIRTIGSLFSSNKEIENKKERNKREKNM